jgi:hypothetical protein
MVDKTLRYTLSCVCYVEAWYAPICLVTQSFINHCIRFSCNSADTKELPDDGKSVSKHVGAAE